MKYRAQTIARTETTFARNISTVEAAKGAGFTEWVCYDNRTGWNDPDCAAADGTVVTEDEMRTMIAEEHPRGTRHFSPRART